MKKNNMKNSNNITNKSNKQVTNKKQNQVTDCKSVTDSKDNIGFEAKEQSYESRDCK